MSQIDFVEIKLENLVGYYNNEVPNSIDRNIYYEIDNEQIKSIVGDELGINVAFLAVLKPLIVALDNLNLYVNAMFLKNDSLIELQLNKYKVYDENKFLLSQLNIGIDNLLIVHLAESLSNLQYSSNFKQQFTDLLNQILGITIEYCNNIEIHNYLPSANNYLYPTGELFAMDTSYYESYVVKIKVIDNPNNISNNIIKYVATILLPQQQTLFIY
jgi:hypothetical protein